MKELSNVPTPNIISIFSCETVYEVLLTQQVWSGRKLPVKWKESGGRITQRIWNRPRDASIIQQVNPVSQGLKALLYFSYLF